MSKVEVLVGKLMQKSPLKTGLAFLNHQTKMTVSSSAVLAVFQEIRKAKEDIFDGDSDSEMEMKSGNSKGHGGDITGTLHSESDEVQKLTADTDKLEREILKRQQELERLSARKFPNTNRKALEDEKPVEVQKEDYNNQLKMLSYLTGIKFTSSKTKVVNKAKEVITRRTVIGGVSGDVEFSLEMMVEETMKLDFSVSGHVTDLVITTSEDFARDLHEDKQRLAKEHNVQGFLRLLASYNRWKSAQHQVFDHFQQQYPTFVVQKDRQVLTLQHPERQCAFDVYWGFAASSENTVLPSIDISVHVPDKVLKTNPVLEAAKDKFQLMLKELGVEKTLNTLILLLKK